MHNTLFITTAPIEMKGRQIWNKLSKWFKGPCMQQQILLSKDVRVAWIAYGAYGTPNYSNAELGPIARQMFTFMQICTPGN